QSQQRPDSGGQSFTMRGSGQGQYGSKMKQFSRVWIEDENGKLKLVFIKTGVTDNTYSEVTWGNLKEGQEVITGEASGKEGSSSSNLRRGMMFMRR
ncbi:MAG: efflux RND transporter periplasmic adaptor subunit, partial [Candidatus Aminicenantes bacterium]|nr:efflux RND transporter periplasmic adaptor subunit [Candidatus Aminicenantes bacterium]